VLANDDGVQGLVKTLSTDELCRKAPPAALETRPDWYKKLAEGLTNDEIAASGLLKDDEKV
jgi:hypothetical protein